MPIAVGTLQRIDQRGRRIGSLHIGRIQRDIRQRPSSGDGGKHIVDSCALFCGHHRDVAGIAGHRLFVRFVEPALRMQLFPELFILHIQIAQPIAADAADIALHAALRLIHRKRAPDDDLHAIAHIHAAFRCVGSKHHARQPCAFILQRKIPVSAAMSGQIGDLSLDEHAAEIRILIQHALDVFHDGADRVDSLVHLRADPARR